MDLFKCVHYLAHTFIGMRAVALRLKDLLVTVSSLNIPIKFPFVATLQDQLSLL